MAILRHFFAIFWRIKSYSLPQHLLSWIHWLIVQWADQAWALVPSHSHQNHHPFLLLHPSQLCPIQDEPGEVCSRPCRPCLYTRPSRFQPLSGRSASREFSGLKSRACGVSPGGQLGSRARPQFYLHIATPAKEGKTKLPGQAGHTDVKSTACWRGHHSLESRLPQQSSG